MFVTSVGKRHTKNFLKGRESAMPRQTKQPSETEKRIKVIEKLFAMGIITEEQVKKLTPQDFMGKNNITFGDIAIIHELQNSIKNNTVYSFLSAKSEVK